MDEIVAIVEPGARILRTWTLPGGLSAEMTVVEVASATGELRRLVVRRARYHRSMSVAEEFRLLVALRARGLPTPAPRHLDESGTCAVLDYVDGSSRFSTDDPEQMGRTFAALLAAIHEVDGSHADFAGMARRPDEVARHLAEAPAEVDDRLREGAIRAVLRDRWPPPPPDRVALLHGDLWPGNVLWDDEDVVVAVIDWEDAAVGDPLADVAITRLDLLWAFGPAAMSAFTDRYLSLHASDVAALPLWDLVAALRPAGALSLWAADWANHGRRDVNAASMLAAQRWFVDQALDAL